MRFPYGWAVNAYRCEAYEVDYGYFRRQNAGVAKRVADIRRELTRSAEGDRRRNAELLVANEQFVLALSQADRPLHEAARYLRIQTGLSQSQLAALADVNKETVNRFELGENIRVDTQRKIVFALRHHAEPWFKPGMIADPTFADEVSRMPGVSSEGLRDAARASEAEVQAYAILDRQTDPAAGEALLEWVDLFQQLEEADQQLMLRNLRRLAGVSADQQGTAKPAAPGSARPDAPEKTERPAPPGRPARRAGRGR